MENVVTYILVTRPFKSPTYCYTAAAKYFLSVKIGWAAIMGSFLKKYAGEVETVAKYRPSNLQNSQTLSFQKFPRKTLRFGSQTVIFKKWRTKKLWCYTRGLFHDTSERVKPGSPHTLGQWEKHFVSKTENDTKIAQMPLKWQEMNKKRKF